jgi:hypothetical protein
MVSQTEPPRLPTPLPANQTAPVAPVFAWPVAARVDRELLVPGTGEVVLVLVTLPC